MIVGRGLNRAGLAGELLSLRPVDGVASGAPYMPAGVPAVAGAGAFVLLMGSGEASGLIVGAARVAQLGGTDSVPMVPDRPLAADIVVSAPPDELGLSRPVDFADPSAFVAEPSPPGRAELGDVAALPAVVAGNNDFIWLTLDRPALVIHPSELIDDITVLSELSEDSGGVDGVGEARLCRVWGNAVVSWDSVAWVLPAVVAAACPTAAAWPAGPAGLVVG